MLSRQVGPVAETRLGSSHLVEALLALAAMTGSDRAVKISKLKF